MPTPVFLLNVESSFIVFKDFASIPRWLAYHWLCNKITFHVYIYPTNSSSIPCLFKPPVSIRELSVIRVWTKVKILKHFHIDRYSSPKDLLLYLVISFSSKQNKFRIYGFLFGFLVENSTTQLTCIQFFISDLSFRTGKAKCSETPYHKFIEDVHKETGTDNAQNNLVMK